MRRVGQIAMTILIKNIVLSKSKNKFIGVQEMKKIFSKLFILLTVSVILSLLFVGCSTSIYPTNDSDNSTIPTMEKHTISITMDNYDKYIEVSTSTGYGQTSYYFVGCLSYAYYDVTFTLSYKTSSNSDIAGTETELVTCNAAGNGTFAGGGKYGAKIISVTGTVIYWI